MKAEPRKQKTKTKNDKTKTKEGDKKEKRTMGPLRPFHGKV